MESPERLASRLKLSDLRLLRAIADHGAIGKAAQHLNLTQPAVSKALAAMEQTLGVRLLDRSRQGATPTLYGEAMLAGGLAVFDELRQSVVRIRHLTDPNSGVLRIGCTQPIALGFLPTVIERVRRDYPGIRFRVLEGDSQPNLRQRRIDLAISRSSTENADPDFHEEALFNDPLLITAATTNPWARRRKVSLKDIYDGPWTIPFYDSHVGRLITEGFHTQGLEPPLPHMTTYAITLTLGLLNAGPYFGITARSLLRLNAGRLPIKELPVPFRHRPSPVVIVTVKNRTLSPAAELFIRYAREAAKALSKGDS